MRVALIPSAYAPAIGGVEALTARLAHRLVASGDVVEIWTIRHPPALASQEQIEGLTVRRFQLPMPRLALGPLLRFPLDRTRSLRDLGTAVREFRPEILHVQCFGANGVYAAWLGGRFGLPLVISLQGETFMDDHDIYDRSLALRAGLRHGLRSAAAVTGCSHVVLADAERRFGLPPGDGVVIPNGIELDEDVHPESVALPFARFVFGLGRIVEKKGFDLLLAAFGRLAERHPDVGLVIGGDGPARSALLGLSRQMGLERRVVFPGLLNRGQVAWAMQNADAFVLPSRIEPFGIVVLEALCAGCPAIVSSHGGAAEIVRDGIDGLVVDPCDPGEMVDAIDSVLGDGALAGRLRAAGPDRAAEFGWDTIVSRYRDLYSGSLTQRRQG